MRGLRRLPRLVRELRSKMKLVMLLLLSLVVAATIVSSARHSIIRPKVNDTVLEKLKRLIADNQVKNTSHFVFPYSMYKQKGTYSSYIHLNWEGGVENEALRHAVKFYDVNAFVTLWVTSVLLEVTRFSNHSTAIDSDQQLIDAVSAVTEYHDKNVVGNTTSLMVFWPQTYNGTTDTWTCSPTNLEGIVKSDEKIAIYVQKILEDVGLGWLWDKIAPTLHAYIAMTKSFYIPRDFDDTFVNVGLGMLLKDYQNVNPMPYQMWLSRNQNLKGLFLALKKYAYRPFSQNRDSNLIDPRTFFYMRDFIHEAQTKNQNIALIPTWVLSLSEDRILYYKGVAMPFNINNVDLTVCTNTLYGITAAVLSGLIEMELFDDDMQLIYESTASLIAWEISHNFSSRPDLVLTYYPSVYNFFWFTSRILNLLNRFEKLPALPVFGRVRSMLLTAMKQHATKYILKRAVQEGQSNTTYFDDFLGDGDKDIFGKPVKHGDDRICSTAMAANTLFYTWTTNSTIDPDTPTEVRDTIVRSCEWLNQNTLSGKYRPMNTFFSGSIKVVPSDFGGFFPSNVGEFLNGTTLPTDYEITAESSNIVIGVSGVIPQTEYVKMLSQKHYGYYTPVDFHGYNNSSFPFWSSEPFTYASTLLALTQCKTIIL